MKHLNDTPRWRPSMMMLLLLVLLGFFAWAAFFELDHGVRAQGQVIATGRTQIIQAADGGVLAKLVVSEGEQVKEGQLLAILEKSRAEAGVEESRAKSAALRIALARANAEAQLKEPVFDPQIAAAYRNFVQAQQTVYLQRKRSMSEESGALRTALVMAKEELRMNETLLSSGDVSRLQALQSRRQVNEIESRLAGVRNKYQQEASGEAAKLEEELSSVYSRLEERQSVLDHTSLTAPVAGIVKFLKVTTIGGVLRAGDELMQIAPTDDALVIEAKVAPMDIGQLHTGLPVTVKLDAFDYSVYGTLNGELTYISPDTLSESGPNGQTQTFYRVRITLAKHESQLLKARNIAIKAGMNASVDIRAGHRSVLQYLTKPIYRAFGGALSER